MMKEVKIFQIQNDAKYKFMSYDFAKPMLNLNDYTLVANFNTNEVDDNKILNTVWNEGNDGTLQIQFPKMYSVSMSNIIEIDNIKYYVDTFGFKEVEL